MKLIDNWKKGWKFISVHCMVLAQAIIGSWMALPMKMQDTIPVQYVLGLAVVLLAAGIVGRFVDQGDATK